jgi:hypothetical protein
MKSVGKPDAGNPHFRFDVVVSSNFMREVCRRVDGNSSRNYFKISLGIKSRIPNQLLSKSRCV